MPCQEIGRCPAKLILEPPLVCLGRRVRNDPIGKARQHVVRLLFGRDDTGEGPAQLVEKRAYPRLKPRDGLLIVFACPRVSAGRLRGS